MTGSPDRPRENPVTLTLLLCPLPLHSQFSVVLIHTNMLQQQGAWLRDITKTADIPAQVHSSFSLPPQGNPVSFSHLLGTWFSCLQIPRCHAVWTLHGQGPSAITLVCLSELYRCRALGEWVWFDWGREAKELGAASVSGKMARKKEP